MSSNIRPSSAQAWSSNLARINSREMEADAVVQLAESMIAGINCSAKDAQRNLRDLQIALGVNNHETFKKTASKIQTLIEQADALKDKEVIFKDGKIVDKNNSNISIVQQHGDEIEINEPPPVVQGGINEGANPEAAPAQPAINKQKECFEKIKGKGASVDDIHAFVQSVEVSNKDTKTQLAVASKKLKQLKSQGKLTEKQQETLNKAILGVEFLQASVGFYEKMSKKYGKECVEEFFLREKLKAQRTTAQKARKTFSRLSHPEKQLRGDIFRLIETQCKGKAAAWKVNKQTNDATLKDLEKKYGLASVNAGLASYPSKEERPAMRRGEKRIKANALEEQIQAKDKDIINKVFAEGSDGDLTFMAYGKEIPVGKKVLQSMKLWDKAAAGKLTAKEIEKAKTQCMENIDVHVNGINKFLLNINHAGTITRQEVLEIAYAAGQGKLVMKLLRNERFTKSEAEKFFKEVVNIVRPKEEDLDEIVGQDAEDPMAVLYSNMQANKTRCSTIGELERAYKKELAAQVDVSHHLEIIRGYFDEQSDKDKVTEEVFNQALAKVEKKHPNDHVAIQDRVNEKKLTRDQYDLIFGYVHKILNSATTYADYENL